MSEEQPRNAQAGQRQKQLEKERRQANGNAFSNYDLTRKNEDFMYQLSNAVSQNKDINDIDICTFYRDNIFLNISALNSTSTAISVCPASEEEVNYVKENGHWRNFE